MQGRIQNWEGVNGDWGGTLIVRWGSKIPESCILLHNSESISPEISHDRFLRADSTPTPVGKMSGASIHLCSLSAPMTFSQNEVQGRNQKFISVWVPLLPFFFFPFSLPSIFCSLSLRLEAAPSNRSRDLGNAVSSPSEPQTCFWYLEPGERVWWLKSEKVCSIYVEKNVKTEANEANVLFPDCLWNFSYFIFLMFQRPKYPPPVTALLKYRPIMPTTLNGQIDWAILTSLISWTFRDWLFCYDRNNLLHLQISISCEKN